MSGAATVGRLVVTVSGDVDQLKVDMREAQAITGAATKDIVNGLQGITDATFTRNAAGQRMVAALQQEIDTFGMSNEQLTIYKAGLLGVGDQAAAMIARLSDMKSSQAAFTNQLAASEAAATQRIHEMVAASVSEGEAMRSASAATQGAAAAQTQLLGVSRNLGDAHRLMVQNMNGVAASMRAAQGETVALSAETQKILDRYDPLGTKLRSLEADFANLRKSMGNSVDPAAIKAFQGLEDEITKTKSLMVKAGVEGFGALEEGAKKGMFATAGATRELIVMGHEALTGNFSRMPGSFMVLAERINITEALLSPMTIGLVALAGAAVGIAVAMAKGHDEMVAMDNALLVTSNYAGMSRQSMDMLAQSMTQTKEITIGTANSIVLALVASGRIGGDSINMIGHFISDFAKSTGESVDKVAPQMIKLFEDPLKGAEELNRSMHFLTTAQIEHIAALERTGQVQAAQTELAKAATDHMPKQAQNLGVITQALLEQRDAWTKLWQAMMGWGMKQDKPDQQAQAMRDQISELLARGVTRQDPSVKSVQAALDALEPAIQKQKEMTQAEKDSAAANELQAKSWDAVKAKSETYHISALRDQLALIQAHKSEAGPDFDAQEAAKRDAVRKTQKEIEDAYRSIGAVGRQLNEQQISNEEHLREVALKGGADTIDTKYKLGQITKEQFDAAMTNNKLDENYSKQVFERQMANIAGRTVAERAAHLEKLSLLKAEWNLIEQQGVNKGLVDEYKSYHDIFKAIEDAGVAEAKRLDDAIAKQRLHNAEIGKSKEQIELAKQAAEDIGTVQMQSDADFIRNAIAKEGFDDQALAAYTMRLTFLDAEIVKRKDLSNLLASGAALEADAKAAAEASKAWKHTADTVQNDLTNAILDGGGKGWKKLVHDMEFAFARMVLQPIIQPIASSIASYLNPLASQAQAGGSGMSSYVSVAQSAKSAYDAISSGFTGMSTTVTQYAQQAINALGVNTGQYAGMSSGMVSPAASAAGTAAGYAGGIAAGKVIGSAISGQYSVGDHGSAIVNIGTAIGAIWGPMGAAIGGAVGGLVNRAFGMGPEQVKGTALNGSLSSAGFTGTNNASIHQDGGWFRSNKDFIRSTPVDDATAKALSSAYDQIKVASADFAKTLGINADSIATRTQALNIALTSDAAANQKAITDFFVGVGDTIATELLPTLSTFAKSGEAASVTFQRLATDYAFIDTALNSIGKTFGAVGVNSLAARERLIDLSGGLTAFGTSVSFFQQNFLSQTERDAPVLKSVTDQMAALGYASVTTRDGFKDLVLGLNLSDAAQAQTYVSLMNLEQAFAQVHPVIDQAAVTLKAAAAALQDTKNAASSLLSGVDAAFSVLQNVVSREKAALTAAHDLQMKQIQVRIDAETAAITKITSLSNALHSTLNSMTAPGQQLTDRANAQAQIKAALAIANAGGPLPDANALQNALSTVSKDASGLFATYQDYQRDFYSTQNDISSLASRADTTLSVDQKTLDALNAQKDAAQAAYDAEIKHLDDIVSSAQAQIDVLKGQSTTLLNIEQAIQGLSAAILNAQANPIVGATAGINNAYQTALGRAPDAAGLAYWQDQAASGVPTKTITDQISGSAEAQAQGLFKSVLGRTGDAAGIAYWTKALGSGLSVDAARTMFMQSDEYKATHSFAVGTNFIPRDMTAKVHAGERIIPAADNRELMSRLRSPNDANGALIAEIKQLRTELQAQNLSIAQSSRETMKILRKFDGDGMPATRTLA
jgi:phage-related minor tail protein